jgi:hypothetical protein
MQILQLLNDLFRDHAPETLMAFFGAATSLLLFYLIGVVLRYLFGWQIRYANWDAHQDQATTALVEALVSALVTEAGHLRATLDSILEESLRRSEQHSRLLTDLAAQAEETPGKTLALLRPEFDHLRRELRQAEARLSAKIVRPTVQTNAGESTDKQAAKEETHP